MPGGKIFNAAENQVLFSPVTNYYQGKAIRLALKNDELAAEQKEKQLEQADAKFDLEGRRVAAQEKQVETQEAALDQKILEHEEKIGAKRSEEQGRNFWHITEEVNEAFRKGGKTKEAEASSLKLAEELFTEHVNSMSDGDEKDKALEILEGGITSEEYRGGMLRMADRLAARYGFGESSGQSSTIERMIDELPISDEEKSALRKGYVDSQIAGKPGKEPKTKSLPTPTRSEEEAVSFEVDQMIKEFDKQDIDVSDKDITRVKGWIGEQAEAIIALEAKLGNSIGFNTGVQRALEESKKFLVTTNTGNFFIDADKEWQPPAYGIGETIIRGDAKYIVIGYAEDGDPMLQKIG